MTANITTTKEKTMNTYVVTPLPGSKSTVKIKAAYFLEKGNFVLFKDDKHAVCFSIRADALLSVRREAADV